MLSTGIWLLTSLGIGGLLGGAIVLWLILNYPKFKLFVSDILRGIGFLGKWVRKKSIETEVEGTINSAVKNFNNELSVPFIPDCRVRWVTESDQTCILEPGKAIVCVNFSKDHDLNVFNATYSFIKTAALPRTKPFLSRTTARAIDLVMTKLMLRDTRREALRIFNQNFIEQEQACKERYYELEESDEKRLFKPLLLQELYFFGETVGDQSPRVAYEKEVEEFLVWFYELVSRQAGELTPLHFQSEHINVGVILIASSETYSKFGIDAYIRRAKLYASNGVPCIYLCSRGPGRGELAKAIAQELTADGCFKQLTRKQQVIKNSKEAAFLITCIALKPDLEKILSLTWTRLESSREQNELLPATIVHVEPDSALVDVYGMRIPVPQRNLTSLDIPDTRMYFRPEQDLEVRIAALDQATRHIELTNVGTSTDPKRIIDELGGDHERELECVVQKIIVSNGRETGLIVSIPGKPFNGFIPRSKATFGRFAQLSQKYPANTVVKVRSVGFSLEHGTFTCEIAGLEDPWAHIDRYQIGTRVNITIKQVSERFLTCEIDEGLEGEIPCEEISWNTLEENSSRIKDYRVGETIDCVITTISTTTRRRVLGLSIKRLTPSPVEAFCAKNVGKKIQVVVTKVLPNGVEVQFNGVDLKGYLHISEMTWGYVKSIRDICPEGSKREVKALSFNPARNSVVVSIKRLIPNDYDEFRNAHQVNDIVLGKPTAYEDDRVMVSIEFGNSSVVQAYIHKSQLSNMIFADPKTIPSILERDRSYPFVVRRFDDRAEVVELSRRELFKKNVEKLQYGHSYIGKVIPGRPHQSIFYGDDLEGELILQKGQQIAPYEKVECIIARIDKHKTRVEVTLA